MEVRLRVRRYDSTADGEPSYQQYAIDAPASATILDSLLIIRERVDGSLAFRSSCRSAICGSCAMRINGASRLACKTKVVDLASRGREITLEPLANLPVIKDLVADMGPFYEKMRAVSPWLVVDEAKPLPDREYLMDAARSLQPLPVRRLHPVRRLLLRLSHRRPRRRLPGAGRPGQGLPLLPRPPR